MSKIIKIIQKELYKIDFLEFATAGTLIVYYTFWLKSGQVLGLEYLFYNFISLSLLFLIFKFFYDNWNL